MKLTPLDLSSAWRIQAEPFGDHRGSFARLYCERELAPLNLPGPPVQINFSLTRTRGAVRGLHFQHPPHAEGKIVRCLRGACFDVMVDLRAGSRTLLSWHGEVLTPDNGLALYLPPGFAHGFQALAPDTELLYLHTEFYTPGSEGGVRFDDPMVGIDWPEAVTDLSERDRNHPLLTKDFPGIEI